MSIIFIFFIHSNPLSLLNLSHTRTLEQDIKKKKMKMILDKPQNLLYIPSAVRLVYHVRHLKLPPA
jgi:hypothetical protein